ncbi:MAG TPA: hypothetical protein VIK78_14715, partial [Ruminiclostridium sp.]
MGKYSASDFSSKPTKVVSTPKGKYSASDFNSSNKVVKPIAVQKVVSPNFQRLQNNMQIKKQEQLDKREAILSPLDKMKSQTKPIVPQLKFQPTKLEQLKQKIVSSGLDLIDRPANAVRVAMQDSIKNKDTHGFGAKIDLVGSLKKGITGEKRATVEEAFKTPNQIKATKYSNPVLDFVSTAVAGGMIDP